MYKVELVVVGDYNDGDTDERRQEVDLDELLANDDPRWLPRTGFTLRALLHAISDAIKVDLKGRHNWWRPEFDDCSPAAALTVATFEHLTGFKIDPSLAEEFDIIQDFLCDYITEEDSQGDLCKDGNYQSWLEYNGDSFEPEHNPALVFDLLRKLAVIYDLLNDEIVPYGNEYCQGVHTIDQIYIKPIVEKTVFL